MTTENKTTGGKTDDACFISFHHFTVAISHGYAMLSSRSLGKGPSDGEMAERFKADTGFRGEVMHSTTTMRYIL